MRLGNLFVLQHISWAIVTEIKYGSSPVVNNGMNAARRRHTFVRQSSAINCMQYICTYEGCSTTDRRVFFNYAAARPNVEHIFATFVLSGNVAKRNKFEKLIRRAFYTDAGCRIGASRLVQHSLLGLASKSNS